MLARCAGCSWRGDHVAKDWTHRDPKLCLGVSFLQLSCTHFAGSWRWKGTLVLLQPLPPYGDVAGGIIPSHLSPRRQTLQS